MDDKEFNVRTDRLEKIGRIIEKLPIEVRKEAFELLKGYVTGSQSASSSRASSKIVPDTEIDISDESFFSKFDSDKPAENAKLIAAWFYKEYGTEPFSLDEVRQKATDVGITIPERVDMTFVQAKEKGKKLFARAGQGKFRPTVHGEANLKATYSVTKGKKVRSEGAE